MRALKARQPAHSRPRTRARGLSLVECLVAVVVLALGLTGMARLMVEGLRAGNQALLRTQAVNLVADMVERIRANPAAGAAYDCAEYGGSPSERNCAATDVSAGESCTPAALAEDDLARWRESALGLLPLVHGEGCAADVTYAPPPSADAPARYSVSVSWREPGNSAPWTHRSDLLVSPP